MKYSRLTPILLCCTMILGTISSPAFETDQFNLSPVPLGDIGDEVSAYVASELVRSVDKVNNDIDLHEACLAGRPPASVKCQSKERERAKIEHLRSNDAIASALFDRIGDGSLLVTKFGAWIHRHKFLAQPSSYKTGYGRSIFIAAPIDYATISPTVRLYNAEFGTDKLEHFFQQGYQYYKILRRAAAQGSTTEKAVRAAVKWGQKTERTYFGTLVSGVFSNADLYANYAGMRFYESMTQPRMIGGAQRPAPVALINGKWEIANDSSIKGTLIKPFITDHLNEALNPSGYLFTIYRSARRAIRKRGCSDWLRRDPTLTKSSINEKTIALELWHGEDYGFTKKRRMITLADTCFANDDADLAHVQTDARR